METTKQKVRVNVYLDKVLTNDAKKLGINLSSSLEKALRKEVEARWKEQNHEKINAYNKHVASNGLPFDDDDICV